APLTVCTVTSSFSNTTSVPFLTAISAGRNEIATILTVTDPAVADAGADEARWARTICTGPPAARARNTSARGVHTMRCPSTLPRATLQDALLPRLQRELYGRFGRPARRVRTSHE